MRGYILFAGLILALALLALGLLLLPGPGPGSTPAVFSALWLLVALASALAFGRELWRRERLKNVRKQWRLDRRRAKRAAWSRRRVHGEEARLTVMGERERRLD